MVDQKSDFLLEALIWSCVITQNGIHKVTKVACRPFLYPSAYFPLTEQ